MKIIENASLKALNTFGVEVSSRYLVTLDNPYDFSELLENQLCKSLPLMVLGGGSNILFRNNYPGVIALMRFAGIQKLGEDEKFVYLKAAAGENWHKLVRYSLAHGWHGLENLSLIPGSVGAAAVQNIGAYGIELADRFHSLNAVDLKTGEQLTFDKAACKFGYRNSLFKSTEPNKYLVTDVTLQLPRKTELRLDYPGIKERLNNRNPTPQIISDIITELRQTKLPDPAVLHNAGSFFKNPVVSEQLLKNIMQTDPDISHYPLQQPTKNQAYKLSAAWLIEQCGWKGFREGDAGVSENHALVLVNYGKATGEDIWALAEKIINSVDEKYQIHLQPEPLII